jgi:polyisoprenoid-binding protein YceI
MKTTALKMFGMAAMVALSLTACQSEFEGGEKVDEGEVIKVEGVKYVIDPSSSKDDGTSNIFFTGSKFSGTHSGSFPAFTGLVTIPGGDFAKGSLIIDFDLTGMTSDDTDLTATLKGEKMFDVANHPTGKFEATAIAPIEGKTDQYAVTGNLTLKGNTSGVKFNATVKVKDTSLSAETTSFVINRKDFGIDYDGKVDDIIHDNVKLTFYVEAFVEAPAAE